MPDSTSTLDAPQSTAHDNTTPVVVHVSPGRLKLVAMIAGGVAAVVVVGGLVTRVSADQGQKSWTQQQAIPTIGLAKIDGGGTRDLALPGDVQA
ncbi:MAG: hypothetical protein E8A12_17175, partial [Phenylobacterium sp.]